MRLKHSLSMTWLMIAAVLCGFGSPLSLRAQSAAGDKCQSSTVDDLGDAKAAQSARTFLADLQAAVQANDKDKIAGMISYPLNFIHAGKRARIRDKQAFLARYDQIFNGHVRTSILKQSAHCLFGNYQGEMIGSGEVWFSELGDGSVKIITINPSAGM